MPKKKTPGNAQYASDWVSSSPGVGLPRHEPVISVVGGKLVIRATSDLFPSSFGFQHALVGRGS